MPEGGDSPKRKKEGQDLIDQMIHLAPLVALILQALELILELLDVI
jgi:hypothetical protein